MSSILRRLSLLGIIVLAAYSATAPSLQRIKLESWPDSKAAAAARIQADVEYLASDELEGRGTGTPGYDKAAAYVVNTYKSFGLTPAGDAGTYLQAVPLENGRPDLKEVSVVIDGTPLTVLEDFAPDLSRAAADSTVTAELVYAGYGIDAPELGHTDYKNIDVAGKIAVIKRGAPENIFKKDRQYSNFNTKAETAREHGAIGTIFFYNDLREGETKERWARGSLRSRMSLANSSNDNSDDRLKASVMVFDSGLEKIAAAAGVDRAVLDSEEPRTLSATATIRMPRTEITEISSHNVVGIIPGADSALRDQYVVISAHLDHLGKDDSAAKGEDSIYNGAMDNAVGTASMLEVARHFASADSRPRRSLLFIAVTAEESGFLGSRYFASNPTIPMGSMVANVNLDMPILTHDFVIVGPIGAEHSTLFENIRRAAESMGLTTDGYDPEKHGGGFIQSDQYSFARAGVPAIFLRSIPINIGEEGPTWSSEHYHRVTDELGFIDWDAAAKFAELNYRILLDIANADQKPAWNDESEYKPKDDTQSETE